MIRRPPRSTLDRSSAASDVYKRQVRVLQQGALLAEGTPEEIRQNREVIKAYLGEELLSLIHISEPTRPY